MTKSRETVYDEQVNPLMTEIIRVCKEHHVPMVAVFELSEPDDGDPLLCTTALLPEEWRPHKTLVRLLDTINIGRHPAVMETIVTNPDGTKSISIWRIS